VALSPKAPGPPGSDLGNLKFNEYRLIVRRRVLESSGRDSGFALARPMLCEGVGGA